MNSYTTEQLLMCEKGDLVKYIEELKEQLKFQDTIHAQDRAEVSEEKKYSTEQRERADKYMESIADVVNENEKLKKGLDKCLEVMRMTEEEMKLNKLSE